MAESLENLTRIYSSRGPDGLSRMDRERLANYKRTEYLFDKFLKNRTSKAKLQLTHEHILDLGDLTLRKFESKLKQDPLVISKKFEKEKELLQQEVESFKRELEKLYYKKYEEQKKLMKKNYEDLMQRIERQRDEAEEERVKELIQKLNDECEEALRRQWKDAEELRRRTIEEMREQLRREIFAEAEAAKQRAIREALEKAEEEYKLRELAAIKRTREECQKEADERIRLLCERYDESIDVLLQKYRELEEKFKYEKRMHLKFEDDYRLLQADYKRFMNYTNHYHSDYMMKLRHIGAQVMEDKEYDQRLDERIELFDMSKFQKLRFVNSAKTPQEKSEFVKPVP